MGTDTPLRLFIAQRKHCIACTPEFEGTNLLQVFAFEKEAGPQQLIDILRSHYRRMMNAGHDTLVGQKDIGERWEHMSWVLGAGYWVLVTGYWLLVAGCWFWLFVFYVAIEPAVHFPEHVQKAFAGTVAMAFKRKKNQSCGSAVPFECGIEPFALNREGS